MLPGNGFPREWVQREPIMIKKSLFVVALLSLALAGGCAKGGNGVPPVVTVSVPNNVSSVLVGTSVVATATVTGPSNTAVTWSLSGTGCTGSACGTLTPVTPATTPATATYQAPATTAPNTSPLAVTITATSEDVSTIAGTLQLNVSQVSAVVTPTGAPWATTVTVGQNLAQQFTAVAVPDNAPQTFTWSVTCTGGTNCGTIAKDPTTSGLAVYTAPSSTPSGVVVTATSTVEQSPASDGVATANVTVAPSRLTGTYAFHFSGYDGSNHAVATAGSVTFGSDGTVTSGVEDVVIDGVYQQYTTVSGSYTPSTLTNNNTNNAGTLTLSASGGPTYTYTAVLTSSGIIRMIESDSTGITGSGVMQESAAFTLAKQTFVFGFTGVDPSGNRVGYVGMLPLTESGTISGGLADSNDNGTASSYTSVTGTYSADPSIAGLWHMPLTLTSGTSLDFDFFVAGGATQTKTAPNPLTLYAISKDSTFQALSGSMVYQVPLKTSTCAAPCYNNAAFNGSSISSLTGVHPGVVNSSNVALINGTTDGTSSGTGGTGGFTGNFDQNDNGTILSVSTFPSASQSPSPYTYVATGSSNGRYIFQMLGNPNASPVVAPIPFVLYGSGANRGFLLDQSSSAAMTGAMDPQPTLKNFDYAASELPGTYAASTTINSSSGVTPFVQNLLLTSTGNSTYNVTGTENTGTGDQPLTGAYTIMGTGTGTITLTSPPLPAVATNVIYAIDVATVPNPAYSAAPNYAITDFMMIGTTSGTPSAIIFAQQ